MKLQGKKIKSPIVLLVLALTFGWIGSANAKTQENARVTVIHAIPLGFGADNVDVYANGSLLINGAVPGAMQTFTVPKGNQKIDIYPHGTVPSSSTTPLLSYKKVYLSHNYDVTFVAHLTEDSKPKLSLFKNMTTSAGKKRGWLTVRHLAAAPAVDVRANGAVTLKNLFNSNERKKSFAINSYSVDVVLAGTTTVAIPAATITLKNDVNTIVYAWGSAAKGNLQFKVQEVPLKKDN